MTELGDTFGDKQWNKQYAQLAEFKRKNGNCLVPQRYEEGGVSLGVWVRTQRQHHSKNKLRLDRKRLLDELGFVWKAPATGANNKKYDKYWHQHYEKMVEFKRKNGDCLVPQRYEGELSLGVWVRTQRQFHGNNKIRLDRKGLLDEIGFVWKVPTAGPDNKKYDKHWYQHYEKLVEFKRKNGNCLVPQRYQEDATLGLWVVRQRHLHTKNKLRLDRKELLDELGIVWRRVDNSAAYADNKKYDKYWHQHYEKLVEFKQTHGHCLVPQRYEKELSLGVWVRTQRQFHGKNTLRLDRKGLLDELGFVWRIRSACPSPNISGQRGVLWRKMTVVSMT
jgi:hypothetical protein